MKKSLVFAAALAAMVVSCSKKSESADGASDAGGGAQGGSVRLLQLKVEIDPQLKA